MFSYFYYRWLGPTTLHAATWTSHSRSMHCCCTCYCSPHYLCIYTQHLPAGPLIGCWRTFNLYLFILPVPHGYMPSSTTHPNIALPLGQGSSSLRFVPVDNGCAVPPTCLTQTLFYYMTTILQFIALYTLPLPSSAYPGSMCLAFVLLPLHALPCRLYFWNLDRQTKMPFHGWRGSSF